MVCREADSWKLIFLGLVLICRHIVPLGATLVEVDQASGVWLLGDDGLGLLLATFEDEVDGVVSDGIVSNLGSIDIHNLVDALVVDFFGMFTEPVHLNVFVAIVVLMDLFSDSVEESLAIASIFDEGDSHVTSSLDVDNLEVLVDEVSELYGNSGEISVFNQVGNTFCF